MALSKTHPYIVVVTIKSSHSKILNPKSNHFVDGSGDGVPAVQTTSVTAGVWWRFDQLLIIFFSTKTSCTANMNYGKINKKLHSVNYYYFLVFSFLKYGQTNSIAQNLCASTTGIASFKVNNHIRLDYVLNYLQTYKRNSQQN